MITDYHAKYYTHELSKRCSSVRIEKLAGALMDAKVALKLVLFNGTNIDEQSKVIYKDWMEEHKVSDRIPHLKLLPLFR